MKLHHFYPSAHGSRITNTIMTFQSIIHVWRKKRWFAPIHDNFSRYHNSYIHQSQIIGYFTVTFKKWLWGVKMTNVEFSLKIGGSYTVTITSINLVFLYGTLQYFVSLQVWSVLLKHMWIWLTVRFLDNGRPQVFYVVLHPLLLNWINYYTYPRIECPLFFPFDEYKLGYKEHSVWVIKQTLRPSDTPIRK